MVLRGKRRVRNAIGQAAQDLSGSDQSTEKGRRDLTASAALLDAAHGDFGRCASCTIRGAHSSHPKKAVKHRVVLILATVRDVFVRYIDRRA